MQQSSVLAISPSFSSYSSIDFSETATRVSEEFADQRQDFGLEPKCNDFEFNCFANRDEITLLSADEIFSNGEIRTVNSDLKISHSRRPTLVELLEEERYSSLSFSFLPESGEPSALPGTFCIWKPDIPAEKCKKTSSMGTLKRLRDLINRGGNDGKKTQIVLSRSSTCTRSKKRMDNNGDDISADKEMRIGAGDEIGKSAHEIHYVKNRSVREADRRRSFLPYKKDLVGIFF